MIPKKHILENEVAEALKTIIKDEYKMQIEILPPGTHRRNSAEVAIRNFKAHLDRLLPQAEITISLLRQSNETPNVLAYAHLSGPFNYKKFH